MTSNALIPCLYFGRIWVQDATGLLCNLDPKLFACRGCRHHASSDPIDVIWLLRYPHFLTTVIFYQPVESILNAILPEPR